MSATNSEPNAIDRIFEATLLRLFPRFITPNQLTVFRFLSVPFVIYLLLTGQYFVGGILFGLSALTDAIDGAVARTRNQVTDWGRVYDPIADKFLIASAALILVAKFINTSVAVAMVAIDLLIAVVAVYQTRVMGKIVSPHWTGKLKMVLQSFGIVFIFLNIIYPLALFLVLAEIILYLSIAFAAISLIIYKSA